LDERERPLERRQRGPFGRRYASRASAPNEVPDGHCNDRDGEREKEEAQEGGRNSVRRLRQGGHRRDERKTLSDDARVVPVDARERPNRGPDDPPERLVPRRRSRRHQRRRKLVLDLLGALLVLGEER